MLPGATDISEKGLEALICQSLIEEAGYAESQSGPYRFPVP